MKNFNLFCSSLLPLILFEMQIMAETIGQQLQLWNMALTPNVNVAHRDKPPVPVAWRGFVRNKASKHSQEQGN